MSLTLGAANRVLSDFSVSLTSVQLALVGRYIALLLYWNRLLSLTTITDQEEIVRRHFGEGFFAVGAVPLREGRLADVGSGAGFPGAAIALLNPSIHVTLIESNTRKAAFLEAVRQDLKLLNLQVERGRIEDCTEILAAADFITARAFGPYDKLLKLLRKKSRSSVQTVLWLGEENAAELAKRPDWKWNPPIRIPGSAHRVLLIGTPQLPAAP